MKIPMSLKLLIAAMPLLMAAVVCLFLGNPYIAIGCAIGGLVFTIVSFIYLIHEL